MKRSTNSRIAGVSFLVYIAFAITAMLISQGAKKANNIPAKLAMIAEHAGDLRLAAVLNLACAFAAILLGVSLYAITRDQDEDLAMIGLACRVAEGVVGAISIQGSLDLLWLATSSGGNAPDPLVARSLGAFLIGAGGSPVIAASLFAVGSTAFTWLLLRGRMVPTVLAWIGLAASVVLLIGLPLQLGGLIGRPITDVMWLPMAAFEIPVGVWLIFKGAALPASASRFASVSPLAEVT